MFNPVRYLFTGVAARLGQAGVIDGERGKRISDLAWPRFLTMFARNLYRVADIAMVGIVIGPAAIAGLAFASVYVGLASAFSLGLAGATIGQVSQAYGAERYDRVDLAVKQCTWVGVLITIPIIAGYVLFATPLVELVGSGSAAIGHGVTYLQIIAFGLLFNLLNHIASRTLGGSDDTWIAMSVRATGAFANVVFNAVLIFGLGLGVAGAAIGTVLAEGIVTACFAWGFFTGSLPIIGAFPVTLSSRRPYFDGALTRDLLHVSPPLIAQYLARKGARFPMYVILATFGPIVVAAFEVGFRIRKLMEASGSGFSMAAAGLVGQELGRDDEPEADGYAGDILRFSAAIYLTIALFVIVFARPLAHFFADDPNAIGQTVPFIRVAAVSFLALGITKSFEGILKAAGDTRWILYAQLVAQYLVLVPITYLGTITPLGVTAVFIAIVAETSGMALITGHRFVSGKWKVVGMARRAVSAED